MPQGTKQKPEWNSDNKVKSSFDELWEESAAGKKEKTAATAAGGGKLAAPLRSRVKHSTAAASANAWALIGLAVSANVAIIRYFSYMCLKHCMHE